MNRTDTDRLIYGESFELNGQRFDPRDVVLNRDGTWHVREWNAHDGCGAPAVVQPDDWVEIEIPNGNRVQCFAKYAGWTWELDYTPGDNYGRHMPGNVIRWRKLP